MTVNKMYPRLVVSDGARAIDFYITALGATENARYTSPEGKIVHAELQVGPATIAVKDADEFDPAPSTLGGSPVIIALDVDNADAVAEAMLAAGATVVFPIHDAEYGERGGRLADPFGHLWMISQRIEDLSPEEIQRRTDEMFAGQPNAG
jgi:PhnB protein